MLPVSQDILCYFVSYLGEAGLAYSTIKSYLSAIRYLQISYGFPSPFDIPMPRLDLILRGIKITKAKLGLAPRRKLPVTPVILRQLKLVWSKAGSDYEQTLLWATSLVCFFGFLRAGEVTLKTKETFDPSYHISFEDVAADSRTSPTYVQLTLKGSKTDPFRKGANVILGQTEDDLCPVSALFAYLRMRGPAKGPLFVKADSSPLTKSFFVIKFREALLAIGYRHEETCQYAGPSWCSIYGCSSWSRRLPDQGTRKVGKCRLPNLLTTAKGRPTSDIENSVSL